MRGSTSSSGSRTGERVMFDIGGAEGGDGQSWAERAGPQSPVPPPPHMPTSSDRSAALAITIGSLAGLVTMALHPSGNDVAQDAVHGTTNLLAPAVHWL